MGRANSYFNNRSIPQLGNSGMGRDNFIGVCIEFFERAVKANPGKILG